MKKIFNIMVKAIIIALAVWAIKVAVVDLWDTEIAKDIVEKVHWMMA